MQARNNKGEAISEINNSYTSNGDCITTSTVYDGGGNPVFQRISIRGRDGAVSTTTILCGKILP